VIGSRADMKPCPRCDTGFDFLTPERIAQRLKEIPIASALAAEGTIYEKRLEICEECEALRDKVLCSHCGCFVMFRARPALSRCPHPEGNRWML
jgi:hypothetical protein